MKRACVVAFVPALVLLAACRSGPSHPEREQGAVKSETTTSSSTTTTTAMTGTTTGSATGGTAADCPAAGRIDGAAGSGGPGALRMVSAQKGFAVDETSVLVTDDGRTWSRRYSGTEPMVSVDAVDADHAWAVGQRVLLATSDGGRSWHPVSEPEQGILGEVDFTDAQAGWGVTGDHVYRTVDGGRTWQKADPPCGGEAVCFTGPDDGWAATGAHVYRSTDGGDSWTPAFTAPTGKVDDPFNALSVHADQLQCARPGVAWVYFRGAGSGGHISYAAYRGTSTGQWTPVLKEPLAGPQSVQAPGGGSYPSPMCALGPETAIYTSYTPLAAPPDNLGLRQATDGGRRLGPVRPIRGVFRATTVSFVTPDTGWVLGAEGGSSPVDDILATTDGGQTWQQQYSYAIPPPTG